MRQVAETALTGKHDFSAFRGAPRGTSDKLKFAKQDTVCHVMDITTEHVPSSSQSWSRTQDMVISIRADRFLYKMVRFLVGAIVAVGANTLDLDDVERMIETGVRHKEFECAPPGGLVLYHVEFDSPIQWKAMNS